jgi:hypothetical protein
MFECEYCGSRQHHTIECPECEYCGSVELGNPFDPFGLETWYDEVIRSAQRKLAAAVETVPGYSTFAKSQWTSELERMWALPTREGDEDE